MPATSAGMTNGESCALLLEPAHIPKLLYALALHLGAVDVAFAVDADEVQIIELAELVADAADAVHDLAAHAIDHMKLAVRVIHDQEIGLRRVGPFDDRADRARIAVLEHEGLAHEGAVLAEELHAIVLAVADHDQPINGDGDAVHRVGELLRWRPLEIPVDLLVARPVAIGAPVPLVGASRGVEHNDALVAVAVGDEQLVGLTIDHHFGGPAEMLGVVRSARRAGLADPHHELAVARELEDVPAGLDIVADPDEVVVIDMDAVPVVAPRVARAIAAPALHHLAVLIEFDHRRRRHTAFHVRRGRRALLARIERAWALVEPDVVLRIYRDAADFANDPVVRQCLRPARIDLEFRHGLRRSDAKHRERVGAHEH